MDMQVFKADTSPLTKGINLIEASAGTGKTFSIAMLVLRFIVEEGMALDKIMVVTFTRAATQELKDRIRKRLVEAKQVLAENLASNLANTTARQVEDKEAAKVNADVASHNLEASHDPLLVAWVAGLENHAEALERISLALADIDNAPIFTIHSFCQRALNQYALESGQLFTATLKDNVKVLKRNIAQDFWRQEVYAMQPLIASLISASYQGPDDLLSSITAADGVNRVYPDVVDTKALSDELSKLVKRCCDPDTGIESNVITPLLTLYQDDASLFSADFKKNVESSVAHIRQWLIDPDGAVPMGAFKIFYHSTLASNSGGSFNGNKFRKKADITSKERKQAKLDDIGFDGGCLDELREIAEQTVLAYRRKLVDFIHSERIKRMQQEGELSYDDLIRLLAKAVKHPKDGQHLIDLLREQYAVALIDEFQDTDADQWSIFSHLFAVASHFLYLIGDPKQAIYKFRGADIHSYLQARQQAETLYYMDTNWRSSHNLVEGVNQLFALDEPFMQRGIDYVAVSASNQGAYLYSIQDDTDLQNIVLWDLDPEEKGKPWKKNKAQTAIRTHVVNEIIRLLSSEYFIAKKGVGEGESQALKPGDMAILVRSNFEAASYQEALLRLGVPAVLNSRQSVFSSDDARILFYVLKAIQQPVDSQLLRQAMVQDWFGVTVDEYLLSLKDERLEEDWTDKFMKYRSIWHYRGVLAMARQLINDYGVYGNLASDVRVERRISNISQLLDLVQVAETEGQLSAAKTIAWLQKELVEPQMTDAQMLRLESDADAVQIVTVHSSKGLEYPIVFCPDLWEEAVRKIDSVVVCHEDNQRIADLGTDEFEQRKEHAERELIAESLRLLYVALTRAKYRCYCVWADIGSTPDTKQSALSTLLYKYYAQWQQAISVGSELTEPSQVLSYLASAHYQYFSYELLVPDPEPSERWQQSLSPVSLASRKRNNTLSTHWRMTSYSGLLRMSHDKEHNLAPTAPAIPELPIDKAEEPEIPIVMPLELIDALPKGADTGNVVHDLLENNPFANLAKDANRDDYAEFKRQRDRAMLRHGLTLDDGQLIELDRVLLQTVTTPLSERDKQFQLCHIDEKNCIKEMPFYLAFDVFNLAELNELIQHDPACEPLNAQKISGLLTGFIDLIACYNGRYYVMDYKTNSLDNYSEASMTTAMRDHNYGLQYWIYTVVLHRYLQLRLPDYDYSEHMGGVRYLFVRGMQADEAGSGVYKTLPDEETVEAMARLLSVETEQEYAL